LFQTKTCNNHITGIAKDVAEQFELFYQCFYNFEPIKITALSRKDETFYTHLAKLPPAVEKSDHDTREIVHHFKRIVRFINALAELRTEMHYVELPQPAVLK
jgi:hypothetical protein